MSTRERWFRKTQAPLTAASLATLIAATGAQAADLSYISDQTVTVRNDLNPGPSFVTITDGVTVTFTALAFAGSSGARSMWAAALSRLMASE